METPENIEIKAKIIGDQAGLRKISGDFMGLAGDLAEPMLLLATGATKAQVAWAALRGVFESKVLGPLSMVAGASVAALSGITKLAKGFADLGMSGAANLQSVETRFKAILRSQQLAAERIRENVDLAKETPYSQGEVMEASRSLQILSQGALATKDNMVLIGDATATAGEEFSNVAKWTGRLYDALQSGAPIGEASMRLQEMGVITGQTRRTLESMTESGASFSETWSVVETQLKKSEGAMKDLSANLEGLQSTYQDTVDVMKAKFSAGFIDGEAATIDATTKLMEALTPSVERLGKTFGSTSNFVAKFKAKIVESIAEIPGLSSVVSSLVIGLTGLLAAMATASGVAMAKFAASLLSTTAATSKATAGISALTLAQGVQVSVSATLTDAYRTLSIAVKSLAAGEYVAAAGGVKLAAIQLWTAVKTNAASVSVIIYRGVMTGLPKVMGLVSSAARAMMASLVANPIMLAVAAIAVLATWLITIHVRYKEAQKRAEDFKKTTNDIIDSLRAQRNAIATTTDLMRAQNSAINELTNSKKALLDANRSGTKEEIALAEARVKAAQAEVDATNGYDRSKLAMTEDETVQRRKSIEDPEAIDKIDREERRAKMDPIALSRDLQKEADEARAKFEAALKERAAQKVVKDEQFKASSASNQDSSDLSSEEARLKDLQEAKSSVTREGKGLFNPTPAQTNGEFGIKAYEMPSDYVARMEEAEKEIKAKIKSLRAAVTESQVGLNAALGGDSNIEKIKARKSLREQVGQARTAVEASQTKIDESGKDATPEQAQALEQLKVKWRSLLDLVDKYDVALDSGAASRDDQDLERETAKLQKAGDRVALAEIERAARESMRATENEAISQTMDAEKAILGLKDLGLAGDLKAIDLERTRLNFAKQRLGMSEIEYQSKMSILAAEEEAAKVRASDRSKDAVTDTRVTQLRLEEEAAKRIGDIEAENTARRAADALEDSKAERAIKRQAKEMFDSAADQEKFVADQMAVEKSAREQRKKFQDEDMARKREGSKEAQDLTFGELREEILRYKGQTQAADKEKKENDKRRDDTLRKDQTQKYIDEGFLEADAGKMADKDVLAQQAARELEKLKSAGTGTIVASSLARIGGGGNVTGTDPVASRIDITNKLLAEIRDRESSGSGVE